MDFLMMTAAVALMKVIADDGVDFVDYHCHVAVVAAASTYDDAV